MHKMFWCALILFILFTLSGPLELGPKNRLQFGFDLGYCLRHYQKVVRALWEEATETNS